MSSVNASTSVFDYVIVGGGTAGCVLADRLSANGQYSVLVLEAGPADRYPWIHVPIGYAKTMFHPVYNWRFETEPEPEMNGRKVYWPRGRTLGGSSSINGLVFIRGQAEDYDHWADIGNEGWSYKDVLPYFKKLEDNTRGESEFHGAGGPITCSDVGRKHELIEAIIKGGGELGVPANDDFNGARQEGVGYFQLFTRRGLRCSTAVGYLRPARKRANLSVETDAQATALHFDAQDSKRVNGVTYQQKGQSVTVKAAREVILAAGALQSPHLMQLSGIGAASVLSEHGITVHHELPGVGENLQDHLQFRLIFRCTKPITLNDDLASWWRSAKIGMEWAFKRSGPLAVGINQGGMFTSVMPESKTPDIQFHFATLSADMAGSKPHPFPGFTFSVCQLRPSSRGHVRPKTRDPLAAPAMVANYLTTEEDRRCAVESIKFARKLSQTQAMSAYVAEELKPGPSTQTDEEILEFARSNGATIFHPAGTCKMGDDPMAVVDSRLRVHGLRGLRVVDCSIMPTLVSGNTSAPVAMIAEKASDMILEDARADAPAAVAA
ncbi:MAG: GMC family oxidoreductase [Burkholderiaceae bacterium]